MTHRKPAAGVLLALFVGIAFPSARAAEKADSPAATRPNIIFIFTDDHATHAISAYGSKVNKTPNIDRIAAEGVLFNNCFCTNSLCGPSRAVIQTGKFSHVNGFIDNSSRFDGSQQTFPKLLQKAGYATAIVGKWHLVSHPQGYDYWEVLPGQGHYYNPDFIQMDGKAKRFEGYVTDLTTDKALAWLKEGRAKDKPFMLMIQQKAPHRNWEPSPDHLTMYNDATIPEPATLLDTYEGRGNAAREQEMEIGRHMSLGSDLKVDFVSGRMTEEQKAKWTEAYGPQNEAFKKAKLTGKDLLRWKYQRYMKDYLRCIASVDDGIGRVLDYLKQSGLEGNTIVIYSSDQGFFLGDHGWYDKRWMYEESLRMPLIVKWPGVTKPGSQNGAMAQNLDFAQTFLEMAGVPIPADMQGRSLVPLLKGQTPTDWRDAIYYHYYEYPESHRVAPHYGVRTDRYKLIHFYHPQHSYWELYDLEKDPQEMKSVYGDPAYEQIVSQMKARLEGLQQQYKDTEPTKTRENRRPPRGEPESEGPAPSP